MFILDYVIYRIVAVILEMFWDKIVLGSRLYNTRGYDFMVYLGLFVFKSHTPNTHMFWYVYYFICVDKHSLKTERNWTETDVNMPLHGENDKNNELYERDGRHCWQAVSIGANF